MKKATIIALGLGSVLIASAAGAQMFRGSYDEPAFEVVHSEKRFEIRSYEPRIVAETTVQAASLREATSEGFGRLAGYIFGKNRTPEGESSKIAMTTPVESVPAGQGQYTVVFTMPPEYEMGDLPRPEDSRVSLKRLPAEVVATARFGGIARRQDLSAMEQRLRDYIVAQGYREVSTIAVAQYDPPWIPGFARRNELMVGVELAR